MTKQVEAQMITTQKVLFDSLELTLLNTFELYLLPFNSIGTLKTLANVSNQFLASFGVFDSFLIIKTSQE